MIPTREDIRRWLEEGKEQGATHVIIVCDEFDWSDYPVYVAPSQNVRDIEQEYAGKEMQKIMEIYNLALPIEPQLREISAYHP